MNEIKERKYSKNQYLIPNEKVLNPLTKATAFRTSDNEIYIRTERGPIISYRKKIRGKKARKMDKINRRNNK